MDTDYNDVMFVSAGVAYPLSRSATLGIDHDFQQAVTDGTDDFAMISLSFSQQLTQGANLSVAIKAGLTDNSPDKGFSLSASFPFK